VTGTPRAPRSPARGAAPESGPLRMRTHTSVSRGRGGAKPVTLSDLQDEATARAAKLQAQVDELMAQGRHKAAYNKSVAALQASLAREARRRPLDTIALYQYFTEQNVRLIREMPGYRAEEGDPQ
jgi:hypothetical protein